MTESEMKAVERYRRRRERERKRYNEDPEYRAHVLKLHNEWNKAHRMRRREYERRYIEENREKRQAYMKRWRAEHPERVRAYYEKRRQKLQAQKAGAADVVSKQL